MWLGAYAGSVEVVRELLRRGVTPSAKTHADIGEFANMTALDVSLYKGHAEVAKLLRETSSSTASAALSQPQTKPHDAAATSIAQTVDTSNADQAAPTAASVHRCHAVDVIIAELKRTGATSVTSVR